MLPLDPSDATGTAPSEQPERPDSRRFADEVMPHGAYLLGHAIGLTRHRSDAEDLVQDTLIKAYVSFGTFREGTNVRAWLYRIMANTWVDKHRSTLRRPAERLHGDLTDPQLAGQARLDASLPSAESEALQSLPGDAEVALRELPLELRVIVYYADVQGYRNTEVAEMLHIPVGTVGSRLFRGRRELRTKLAGRCDTYGRGTPRSA
jgi:RNA polymerase sigma-70 factor, ECF subfamily